MKTVERCVIIPRQPQGQPPTTAWRAFSVGHLTQAEATAFFTASAENLQREAARAGVRQIVVVSIIGIDDFTGGYYAAKIEQ